MKPEIVWAFVQNNRHLEVAKACATRKMVRGLNHHSSRLFLYKLQHQPDEGDMTVRMRHALILLCALSQAQPLQDYVHGRDDAYQWKLIRSIDLAAGAKGHILELTSQRWRSETEVDKPVWKHWLTIVQPAKLTSKTGLLFIGSGSNLNPVPGTVPQRSIQISRDTGTVVAELSMVPNQPLRFTDSPTRARTEDGIIAYSRVKHFATKDDSWLVRLAMVKSGIRAMDAITEFLPNVQNFVISGASKRGWTAWLIAAADTRVIAAIPMVIDALNSEAITRHHFEAYGFFSSSLNDYVEQGLFPHKIGTPEYQAVLKIEDPYSYRDNDQLRNIPKYMINASGDEFFLPDNSQFYFGDLKGEKYLRYEPNAKHNLAGSDARENLTAFYQSVLEHEKRPQFSWKKLTDGTLRVEAKDEPSEVRLWQATNPKARDFRLDVIGQAYKSTLLKPVSKGIYEGRVAKPATGYAAFFIELTYPRGPGKQPFKFTTEVSVVPDVLPYKWDAAFEKYPQRN